MKQLTCEMCGGIDLVKTDGYFVCQHCNTKYTVEEAKKMMIEGTVKVDNSEKTENLYEIARRARDSSDSEAAAKYYDMILQEQPNSWEASFYSVYYRAMSCTLGQIDSAAELIERTIYGIIELVKNTIDNEKNQQEIVSEIVSRICDIVDLFYYNSKDLYNKYSDLESSIKEFTHTVTNCGLCLATTFYAIEKYFENNTEIMIVACQLIENDISYDVDMYNMIYEKSPSLAVKGLKNTYTDVISTSADIIKKYKPDYTPPVLKPNNSENNSEGCYVATAVYGSYDCPQVWTLRRYRDYTLAETWYGRAFIRTYYGISPTLVEWFGHTEWFKKMWKGKLDRMVKKLQENGVESTPYEDKNW